MRKISEEVMSYVLNEFHLDLSIYEASYIDKTVHAFLKEMNLSSMQDFINKMKEEESIHHLYNALYNNYSRFFREPYTYQCLSKTMIHRILERKDDKEEVRIWSIGCSKGQEPYSIAITLEEVKRKYEIDFNYRIFATDVSEHILDEGRKGEYVYNDVANVTLGNLDRYFTMTNTGYAVKKMISDSVLFSIHDIVLDKRKYPKDSIYGNFDIIMISNVLIYYNQDIQRDIVSKLQKSLHKDGYLITSSSEVDIVKEFMKHIRLQAPTNIFQVKE